MKKLATAALVLGGTLAIAGCRTEGQDPMEPQLSMNISVASANLVDGAIPVRSSGVPISCGFTLSSVPVTVEVTRAGGNVADLNGEEVQSRVEWRDGRATISRLNAPDDDPDDDADECQAAYGAVPADLLAGGAQFFLTGIEAGRVTFHASMQTDNGPISASRTFRVGAEGSDTPQTLRLDGPVPRVIPVSGTMSQPNIETFTLTVMDEGGNRVPDPRGDEPNVFINITEGSQFVSGDGIQLIDSEGQRGLAVAGQTRNGRLQFSLRSPTEPGLGGIRVAATHPDTGSVEHVFPVRFSSSPSSGPLMVTTTSLPDATTGVPYAALLTAEGGTIDQSWSIVAGQLPSGLSFSSSGIISGTPTLVSDEGTQEIPLVFRVEDDGGDAAQSETLTISLTPRPPEPPPLRLTTSSLPSACQGQPYGFLMSASGGDGAYSWSGTELVGASATDLQVTDGGAILGVPQTDGDLIVAASVTDGEGQQAGRILTLEIEPTADCE